MLAPTPISWLKSSRRLAGPGPVRKLFNYFRVPSIAHYLTMDLEQRRIGHHWRGPDGTIVAAIVRGDSLMLDPPGLRLSLAGVLDEA